MPVRGALIISVRPMPCEENQIFSAVRVTLELDEQQILATDPDQYARYCKAAGRQLHPARAYDYDADTDPDDLEDIDYIEGKKK
jgi:hypothetical protein